MDFGRGAPIRTADGKLRKTWVFRIVLSYSRKAYSEVVLRQTTDAFIRALENAFRYFGGVPETVIIDNLRAAVKQPDWYEPELHPKLPRGEGSDLRLRVRRGIPRRVLAARRIGWGHREGAEGVGRDPEW